jgi:hypothetical protein
MNTFFLIFFGLLPAIAMAVSEPLVYPNSGDTDAIRNENTGIDSFSNPAPEDVESYKHLDDIGSGPKKKNDEFVQGPYDKNGEYRYIPKIRE